MRMRASWGAGGLVVWRRARRDILLLIGWTTLVAFAALLAVATPHLLVATVDGGARAAVRSAGGDSDLIVSSLVGKPSEATAVSTPQAFVDLGKSMRSRLPSGLRATYSSSVVSALGPSVQVDTLDAESAQDLSMQMGILTPAQLSRVVLVSGKIPTDSSTDGVVVSAAGATGAGLKVGTVIHLAASSSPGASISSASLRVDAIVTPKNAFEPIWRELTGMWEPPAGTVTVLAPPRTVLASADAFPGPLQGTIRVTLDPQKFTADLEQKVSNEVARLVANDQSLAAGSGAPLSTQSGFVKALAAFPPQARASAAQMSLVVAGLLGVAGAVIALLSRLLVGRRENELALERARGSSVAGVAARALAEAVVATAAAVALALGVAWLVLPTAIPDSAAGLLDDPLPFAAVLAVAVGAPVLQSVLIARAVWRGKREPANRPARQAIVARARSRRLVIEAAIVVIAIAAVYSLRTRSLLETRTDGVDPLLAAAPLLVALVVTLVALRVSPFVARAVGAFGRRSRGALGVLGSMQLERAITVLPLLALTLAVALAVGGGLLIETVRQGQVDASWQRIGADVRVDTPVTSAEAASVAASPGVSAAASDSVATGQTLSGGASSVTVSVIGMTRAYPGVVALLPASAGGGATAATVLRRAEKSTPVGGPLPIVIDRDASRQLSTQRVILMYGSTSIKATVVGVVDRGPRGYVAGPFVFADLSSISARLEKPIGPTSLLVVGPGARSAAASLHAGRGDVLTRVAWLSERQHRALTSGVDRVLTVATVSVALLAVLALIATVLATARMRARSLALLRTLGMRARLSWWLALAELGPLVAAALIGGVIAAVAMVELIVSSLGLRLLSGGLDDPAPSLSATVILGVVGAAVGLLGVAMLCEAVSHRRDRLGELLRVGES